MGRTVESIFADLIEHGYRCRDGNWDGERAEAIPPAAVFQAGHFLSERRDLLLIPDDVVPDPSGAIALTWYRDKRAVAVAFDGSSSVTYCSTFEGQKVHGTLPLAKVGMCQAFPVIEALVGREECGVDEEREGRLPCPS